VRLRGRAGLRGRACSARSTCWASARVAKACLHISRSWALGCACEWHSCPSCFTAWRHMTGRAARPGTPRCTDAARTHKPSLAASESERCSTHQGSAYPIPTISIAPGAAVRLQRGRRERIQLGQH